MASGSMAPTEGIKLSIKQHYDGCSDHYNGLWGKHIHHGLWVKGDETKEEAQEELIRTLLRHAKLPPNPRILDVGCGVGGTSCYLASSLNATVIGVTISTRQVVMATEGAAKAGVSERVTFVEGDGERLDELDILAGQAGTFDAVWISEALSHFVNKDAFFRHAHNFVKPGGKLVLADWFRADHISTKLATTTIAAIEHGMLLPRLDSMPDYMAGMSRSGLRLVWMLDVSKETAKTWDICLELIANPSLWAMALTMGTDFISFLKSFSAMRDGFANGCFRYGLMVCEKPTVAQLAE